MKRRFLAILAILVGSVSIVTYAQCRQESYVCDEPEITIVEPKKIADGECCVPFVESVSYEEVIKVVDEVQSSPFSGEDEYLLVKIAMAEAEGEDVNGKALVILTVLNRVNSNEFPDTIHDVIYQPDQFSPVGSGRFDAVEPSDECYQALNMVIDGWDESKGALYLRVVVKQTTGTAETLNIYLLMVDTGSTNRALNIMTTVHHISKEQERRCNIW